MSSSSALPPDAAAPFAALVGAFFRAVSFEPPGSPDYAAIRDLFIEDGRLIKNSGASPDIADVEAFIAPRQGLVDRGELTQFSEVETAAITEVFGNVAHRLSTYEKTGTQDGVSTSGRGVISTQFVRTPAGWRMSVMAWDDERPGLELPERYRA
ncbi:MAG: nuclear transport factor 2 family protein [Solirubrobacteraceae bacterium]